MEELEVEAQLEHKVAVKWADLSKHISLLAPFQHGSGELSFKQWIRDNVSKKECCLFARNGDR